MKAHERRRFRAFLAALAADPYRKLAAVALAIGLWFFLHNQITLNQQIRMTLKKSGPNDPPGYGNVLSVVLPTDSVVGKRFLDGEQPIEHVDITLSGPRYIVEPMANSLHLQVTGLDWTNRTNIEFTAADIQRNTRALQQVSIEMKPARVLLEVDSFLYRSVRVDRETVELVAEPALRARLRWDTVQFAPDAVDIRGPASSLARFPDPNKKPFVVRPQVHGYERQITVLVDLAAPEALGLKLTESCTATMQVLPETTIHEVEVPFRVDDLNLPPDLRGKYLPSAPTHIVRIRVGGQLGTQFTIADDKQKLQNWVTAHMRLVVWIPPLESVHDYGEVIQRDAVLALYGPLRFSMDQSEYELADALHVTLKRQP